MLGIKKPPRSYRFVDGLGRSPLSRQALLVGLFTVLLVIHWALVLAAAGSFALGVVTVVVGAAAVLAIGLTYWLPSQPGWRHWSTPVSLFGGVLSVGVAAALVVALAWPDSLAADSAGIAGRARARDRWGGGTCPRHRWQVGVPEPRRPADRGDLGAHPG